MAMKMNKNEFVKKLSETIGYPLEKCMIINDILEDNFFIRKSQKDKIITELIDKLGIDYQEGLTIYEEIIDLMKEEIKYKIKHPFQNQG